MTGTYIPLELDELLELGFTEELELLDDGVGVTLLLELLDDGFGVTLLLELLDDGFTEELELLELVTTPGNLH